MNRTIKLFILLFLLSSCGGEVQDCEQVRITPQYGDPYWVTICTDDDSNIHVESMTEEEYVDRYAIKN